MFVIVNQSEERQVQWRIHHEGFESENLERTYLLTEEMYSTEDDAVRFVKDYFASNNGRKDSRWWRDRGVLKVVFIQHRDDWEDDEGQDVIQCGGWTIKTNRISIRGVSVD